MPSLGLVKNSFMEKGEKTLMIIPSRAYILLNPVKWIQPKGRSSGYE